MLAVTSVDLKNVLKPARYVGGEKNQVIKNKDSVNARIAFCFPDTYEIGMSNLGLKVLYKSINSIPDNWCERVFAPWPDFEKVLRSKNQKLYTLESKDTIDKFDMLAFTLQYEMSYTNVLNMLDLGGIPVYKENRKDSYPFVIAGGPCTVNPAPMSNFIDIFFIGEGEERLNDIIEKLKEWKKLKLPKEHFYNMIENIEGVYIPHLHKDKIINKALISNMDTVIYPIDAVVPSMEVVHDRSVIELFRGCSRGCRFCQAGYMYRPVREKSIETVLKLAKESIDKQGYSEMSMSSLSTGDYSCFKEITEKLLDICKDRDVNLSLPSLRIDNANLEVIKKVQDRRKSSITFAPEAGTDRLRNVINKNITRDQILESAMLAFENGWKTLKLYFMIGLPTETYEDLDGIIELGKDIVEVYDNINKGKKQGKCSINISIANYVPKPHTPFQWCPQDTLQKFETKQQYLKSKDVGKSIKLTVNDPTISMLEALFAKGDEETGRVIYEAWKDGAKFDSWSEFFNFDLWQGAIKKSKINLKKYIYRKIDLDEKLPWDNINTGVEKEFLKKEYLKGINKMETTENCMEKCSNCGVNKKYGCKFLEDKNKDGE